MNRDSIKVSVIVPVYNAGDYLQRTIGYLKKQTLKEIEIILVDDGSVDNSSAICDEACRSDERIKCIHKTNGGVSAARNDGIDAAAGEYLMFCDADDIPDVSWVEKLYDGITTTNSDVVISGYYKESNGSTSQIRFPYSEVMSEREEILHRVVMTMSMWGYSPNHEKIERINGGIWNRIYRKNIIDQNHIRFNKELAIAEDVLFNIEYVNHSKTVYFIDDCLYTYIFNPNSATHTNFEKIWSRYKTTWKHINDALKDCRVSGEDLKWHNFQYQKYAISAVIEGVCSLDERAFRKVKKVKELVSEQTLQTALADMPADIGKKDKIIAALIRSGNSLLLWLYYQMVYFRHYRRTK